jgi:antitoxin FitA
MKMIQIRNVPDDLHRRIRIRAAEQGKSMSDYLRDEIASAVEVPTLSEVRTRIAGRDRVVISEAPADAIRAERDAR